MKFININPKNLKLSPKRLFRSSKKDHLSRSDPPSFSSSSEDFSTSSTHNKPINGGGLGTPTSVLPDDWSAVDVRWAFRLIDRDNDGVVSRADLVAVLTRLGALQLSDEEVEVMLREVDGDGRGSISVEALMERVGPGSDPETELREAFEVFDTDRDGRISAEELLRVFTAIGDERCTLDECRRMIEGVDRNGDGFVCFEDFSRMMELQR